MSPRTLYPAHGLCTQHAVAKLDEYLLHRRARAEALRAALGSGPRELMDLVREVYYDIPDFVHPLAARSAVASPQWELRLASVNRSDPAVVPTPRRCRQATQETSSWSEPYEISE